MQSLKGMLLVSTPALFDPNFRRTVVLIAEHGDEGAVGVVLNRASETTVGEAVPDLAALAGPDEPVFVGGPVQPRAVIVVAEFEDPSAAASIVVGDVGLAATDGDLERLAGAIRRARVFAGYSGWSPGQLESELEEDSWIVLPAAGLDVLADPATDLFAEAVRSGGGRLGLLATMPDDPGLN